MTIYLYILGALLIAGAIIRTFRPGFLLPKGLRAVLESRGTTKKYLLSRQIIGIVFGGALILAGYLPEPQRIPVCMPLLALVFVCILACNKIFVGSFGGKG